ncbi:phosphate/phosphite/phosphonate ABC transporter substrate-binding protein [Aliagarivorans marinus]|uniref:phosphate/phosphite/phosphonate ABC transporter substrate-binding protein n=1 Tax=Aliagarivorans marinus TaxID=561965 RepID=UPI0004214EBD|nr:phosphate/phosphite/phosphonate ABC transporter substrate-binding protein [Aliagarivorans marinus]
MKCKEFYKVAGALLVLFSQPVWAETISFGIVPQQSASRLATLWTPLLQALSEQTGLKVEFKTAPNIPEFERRLAQGEYDVAYMNPYHYQVAAHSPGYKAIAKARDLFLHGIIVVRRDSGIESLAELEGQVLAFPAPKAFAASVVTRAELDRLAVNFSAKYVGSHDSVYRSVESGLYPAGGGVPQTFANVDEALRSELKVLWESKGYSPHAVAVSPNLDPQLATLIQESLVNMTSTEQRQLLNAIRIGEFVAAQDSDWDDIRALGLANY